MSLPDMSAIDTHHQHVPAFLIFQMQLPMYEYVEDRRDGPGWALTMCYKISEVILVARFRTSVLLKRANSMCLLQETIEQLQNFNESPDYIQAFAAFCERGSLGDLKVSHVS